MEKRFQVFISSTYEDLKKERQEVIQALLELDCIPAGMELFPAADEDQWSLIKQVIDDCDYYIVIVGGRYGSCSDNGVSFTQKEYEYALEKGKPVIGFLHRDPGKIATNKSEKTDEGRSRLAEFRELVEKKLCKHWNNPQDLGSVVSRSLIKLMKSRPAIGWVRADGVSDEAATKEILELRKKLEELQASRSSAPEGIEGLSQGDDGYSVQYTCVFKKLDDFQRYKSADYCELSWNDIFGAIAPSMINEVAERGLQDLLGEHVFGLEERDLRVRLQIQNVIDFGIDDTDFRTLIVQFRALGLIIHSPKKHAVKDTNTYWTLTPHGDSIMTRLCAVQKPRPLPEDLSFL